MAASVGSEYAPVFDFKTIMQQTYSRDNFYFLPETVLN